MIGQIVEHITMTSKLSNAIINDTTEA